MTIKARILLLALLAVISLFYILGARFVAESQERSEKQALLTRMDTAEKLSGLVHELQKERGISAGYLASQSKTNAVLLDAQRVATDQAKSRLDGNPVQQELENLAKLGKVREGISRHQVTPVDSFGYYTLTIVDVLDQVNTLAMHTKSPVLKNGLHTHTHLLYAKEYLGEIRASLNEALSNGNMDNVRISLVGQQLGLHQHHSEMFLRDAAPDIASAFRAALAQPKVQATFEIIKSTLSGHGSTVTAEQWFTTASYAIDQLRGVENQTMAYLRQQVNDDIAATERRFFMDAIATLGVSLLLMLLAGSTTLRLLRALKVLITGIEHTIRTKNFANRIQLRGNDEMGVISYNFNELLTIAESLIKEKDYLASTDSLTGAYNRFKFTELFTVELQRALRYGGGFVLIMLDIDHFKRINDGFGHSAGDLVLKELTQLVRNLTRSSDVMTRWGGEEFMILAPGGHEAGAALAEKLRGAIEGHHFSGVPKVTASFGVSEYMPGDTLESLCARVDKALYCAKNEGRNRVSIELADTVQCSMNSAKHLTRDRDGANVRPV